MCRYYGWWGKDFALDPIIPPFDFHFRIYTRDLAILTEWWQQRIAWWELINAACQIIWSIICIRKQHSNRMEDTWKCADTMAGEANSMISVYSTLCRWTATSNFINAVKRQRNLGLHSDRLRLLSEYLFLPSKPIHHVLKPSDYYRVLKNAYPWRLKDASNLPHQP
jgi:hypothetical protein